MTNKRVNVYILSGFLGSGKTTLLTKAITYFTEAGRKPAVIMNEIGEVNLDGQLIAEEVPMSDLLGGCICCSSRGDLATALNDLVTKEQIDVIFVESTGVANPMEIIDEVTDASLVLPIELSAMITVVDAPQLLELNRTSRGKTFRLMRDQIRCANLLLLNKTDLLQEEALEEVHELVREWNPYADLHKTVFSQIDLQLIENIHVEASDEARTAAVHDHAVESDDKHTHEAHHHSHRHVMAYTHFFERAVDSGAFEEFISKLPQEVYRAKGVLTFSDTSSRFLFQYAYREMDFVKITPKGNVPDVAVFIGENFAKDAIRSELLRLEKSSDPTDTK
ncbi:CobW family GTP-binding protein [Paenibacillus roseipurpureus]|uniref:GTP-binding protein n=1 Tax=Paenibacillus roseopurpureus TaxID=2918901 RepID=A0AA96RML7_9BACL|nr:GTP-binding protein [Paenibacillus sp. MBLB1832]WNR46596.1 GTP-binding protein [Paenibacillus sp. MBLB1832]